MLANCSSVQADAVAGPVAAAANPVAAGAEPKPPKAGAGELASPNAPPSFTAPLPNKPPVLALLEPPLPNALVATGEPKAAWVAAVLAELPNAGFIVLALAAVPNPAKPLAVRLAVMVELELELELELDGADRLNATGAGPAALGTPALPVLLAVAAAAVAGVLAAATVEVPNLPGLPALDDREANAVVDDGVSLLEKIELEVVLAAVAVAAEDEVENENEDVDGAADDDAEPTALANVDVPPNGFCAVSAAGAGAAAGITVDAAENAGAELAPLFAPAVVPRDRLKAPPVECVALLGSAAVSAADAAVDNGAKLNDDPDPDFDVPTLPNAD
jgi:hypothetical protein